MSGGLVTAAYIVAAILFIFSLAGLSKHETSQQGNYFGIAAMAISSFVAPKLAAFVWETTTGNKPPSEDEGSRLGQLLAYAAISAVLVTAFQHVGHTMTAKYLIDSKNPDAQDGDSVQA